MSPSIFKLQFSLQWMIRPPKLAYMLKGLVDDFISLVDDFIVKHLASWKQIAPQIE